MLESSDSDLVESLEKLEELLETEKEKSIKGFVVGTGVVTENIASKAQGGKRCNNLLQKQGYMIQLTPPKKVLMRRK